MFSTSTLWSPPSQAETLGTQARWRWFGRCKGGSVCHRRPCRRTVYQLSSPGRLLLYRSLVQSSKQCSRLCASYCSHLWCSWAPRKSHSGPTSYRDPLPFCTSFCRRLLWKLSRSIRSPSSSAQSVPPCTTPVSRNQTCPGDQGRTARSSALLSCFPQTEKGPCVLCLGPEWVCWCLMKQIQNMLLSAVLWVHKETETYKVLVTHISLDLAGSWIHHTVPHWNITKKQNTFSDTCFNKVLQLFNFFLTTKLYYCWCSTKTTWMDSYWDNKAVHGRSSSSLSLSVSFIAFVGL